MAKTAAASKPAPLIVVSNRLPYNLPKGEEGKPKRNIGGLVNALEPVLARRGGCWVGWGGTAHATISEVEEAVESPRYYDTPSGVGLWAVPLGERDVSRYYHGLSNAALWPLFHDFPGKASFEQEDWAAYRRVNRRFATLVAGLAGAGTRVWVHDFHLMLVPRYLRDLGFQGRIEFFLHIPFPAPEIFRILPWRGEVMDGLLAADSVGFHVPLYRDNFVSAARSLAGDRARISDGGIHLRHADGEGDVFAAPIGVDVEDFERIAGSEEVEDRVRKIRDAYGGFILLGVDRLDYTKGIRERLLVLERFLTAHPQAMGQVCLVQIVVPSRHQVEEYRAMKQEIDREVGRINGRFGREGWAPIHYRYLGLDKEELVAHYRSADVALVTPLRDGLNLVAAEFVASRVDGDGVLMLSEFAGVSENARGAVLVNPYDVDGCARALWEALEMPEAARRLRMTRLRRGVRDNPISRWADRCLQVSSVPAAGLGKRGPEPGPRPTPAT